MLLARLDKLQKLAFPGHFIYIVGLFGGVLWRRLKVEKLNVFGQIGPLQDLGFSYGQIGPLHDLGFSYISPGGL